MTICFVIPCFAQRPLGGEWTLENRRSELSGRMRTSEASISQTLRIYADTALVCVVTNTTGGPLGNTETTERIVIDSIAQTFQPIERADSRASSGTRSAQWKPDALQLVVKEMISREIGGGRVYAMNSHTWTLSGNTDTLVVVTNTQGPRGSTPTRRQFVRMKSVRADIKPSVCAL